MAGHAELKGVEGRRPCVKILKFTRCSRLARAPRVVSMVVSPTRGGGPSGRGCDSGISGDGRLRSRSPGACRLRPSGARAGLPLTVS